jgi:hypothetical protein
MHTPEIPPPVEGNSTERVRGPHLTTKSRQQGSYGKGIARDSNLVWYAGSSPAAASITPNGAFTRLSPVGKVLTTRPVGCPFLEEPMSVEEEVRRSLLEIRQSLVEIGKVCEQNELWDLAEVSDDAWDLINRGLRGE